MAETSSAAETPKRRWFGLGSICAILGLVAVVGIPLNGIYNMHKEYQEARFGLPKRHVEATQAIETIYGAYLRDGHWPTEEDVEAIAKEMLPPDWVAAWVGKAPVIACHGTWHSTIAYWFLPLENGVITRDWRLSIEGDHHWFQADVAYSPK